MELRGKQFLEMVKTISDEELRRMGSAGSDLDFTRID